MKIFLVAVNAKYIHSNPAVYSLRAFAEKYSSEISIAEYTINQPVDEILMDLYSHSPDVICFSCYLWNILYVEQLTAELVKVLPHVQIWMGGPEVSYDAPDVLTRNPGVNGVMCGEGEETFADLVQYWCKTECPAEKSSLRTIRGIVYRASDGAIVVNGSRPVLDMNLLPFPYVHVEEFQNRIVYYESSRGCPFSCSYCLSSVEKCLRFRDIRLVEKELQFFIDREVPQVKFVDRTFNCSHDHAMAVWTYIRDHDRGLTNFHFEVAADLLNEEEIRLIRSMRPGLIQLEIGVQSTNPDTVREIRRTMRLHDVQDHVARIREGGNVHLHLDLIAGLPWEGMERFIRSFNEVYAMKPEQLQLGFLKVLKGSLMHEKAAEYGILYQNRPPYEVLQTNWITYGEIIRLKKVEEMTEVYYNSGQFSNTMEQMEHGVDEDGRPAFSDPFSIYDRLASYYDSKGLSGLSHSRIRRYEILYDFIRDCGLKNPEQYREWLTLDIYLRDNVKNRPDFLGENRLPKEVVSAFYKKEAEEHRFLPDCRQYDARQLRKMTHLERIRGRWLLFDYTKRSPLTRDASVTDVSGEMEQETERKKKYEFL